MQRTATSIKNLLKIKTSELIGLALDWAVAKCDGFTPHQTCMYDTPTLWRNGHRYSPSTDWSEGGPIIERERVDVDYWPDGDYWQATSDTYDSFGPTPLIAAMRCYVASKLGDTVDIPEELVIERSDPAVWVEWRRVPAIQERRFEAR